MNKQQFISVLSQFGDEDAIASVVESSLPLRETLPARRATVRKKIIIGQHAVYVEVGFYEDGRPGEVFLQTSKFGTDMRDLFSSLATVISIGLQHGVPLSAYPLKGRGNDLTGEGNALLDSVFTALEDICAQPHGS